MSNIKKDLYQHSSSISWTDFLSLEDIIINSFIDTIKNVEDPFFNNVVRIGMRKNVDISNFFYNSAIKNNSSYSRLNLQTAQLENEPVDYTELIHLNKELKIKSYTRLFLRMGYLFLRVNKKRIGRLFKRPVLVNIDSFNNDSVEYIDKMNYGLIIPYTSRFVFRKEAKEIDQDSQAKLEQIARNIILTTQSKVDSPFKLTPELEKVVVNMLFKHFLDIAKYSKLLMKSRTPRTLITGAMNKTFIRILTAAVRNKGGKVIAFAHGETLQNKNDHKLWLDILLSTVFVEQNKDLADELKEHLESKQIKNLAEIEFMNEKAHVQYGVDNSKELKSILLIGNVYKDQGFSRVTSFEPAVQMTIELKAIDFLQKQNYQVYYKQHPGGKYAGKVKEIFQSLDIEIENRPFESILEEYDGVAFYYTKTSTVKAALKSNKPLLYLDVGIDSYCSKSENVVKKRFQNEKLDL